MQIRSLFVWIAVALMFVTASGAVISKSHHQTNAHILDGTGRVIETPAPSSSAMERSYRSPLRRHQRIPGRTIDAGGKTVMPGLIDAHRHIVTATLPCGSRRPRRNSSRKFLDAGFTTVLAAIDPVQVIRMRKRIEAVS